MGDYPENTIVGIEAAIAAGVDGVEIDVRASADGVAVLMHDATLERTTGDPRAPGALTSSELRALEVADPHGGVGSQPVPDLAQALATVSGRCELFIEIKEPGVEAAVASAVRAAGAAGWCWVWAFDPAVARASRRLLPEVPVALNVGPGSGERYGYDSHLDVAVREGCAAVSLAHSMVEGSAVRDARRRGLLTFTWTVDHRTDLDRVLGAGVDGICSNFPARVVAALSSAST